MSDFLDGCNDTDFTVGPTDDDDVELYVRFGSVVEGVGDRLLRLAILRRVRALVDGP